MFFRSPWTELTLQTSADQEFHHGLLTFFSSTLNFNARQVFDDLRGNNGYNFEFKNFMNVSDLYQLIFFSIHRTCSKSCLSTCIESSRLAICLARKVKSAPIS